MLLLTFQLVLGQYFLTISPANTRKPVFDYFAPETELKLNEYLKFRKYPAHPLKVLYFPSIFSFEKMLHCSVVFTAEFYL